MHGMRFFAIALALALASCGGGRIDEAETKNGADTVTVRLSRLGQATCDTRTAVTETILVGMADALEEMLDTAAGAVPYATPPYSISGRGKQFIKEHEGLRLRRYKINRERLWTIGYGHQIQPGERIGATITIEQAEQIFERDIRRFEQSVRNLIGELDPRFRPTQGFVDALGSLCYNCGESGARTSTFYARLRKCRYDARGNINKKDLEYALSGIKVSKVLMRGHKKRRREEYELAKS